MANIYMYSVSGFYKDHKAVFTQKNLEGLRGYDYGV